LVTISLEQQNPKLADSKSHARYEDYKTANNLQEFFDAGGLPGDFHHDLKRDFLRLVGNAVVILSAAATTIRARKTTSRLRRQPLRFDRFQKFDGSGDIGTVVRVTAEALTVQPDRQGARLVVIPTSQVSSSVILPVVAPESLTGVSEVSVLVPRLGMSQIAQGDTVRFDVGGVLRYALVVGASSSRRVKCFLWYSANDLPKTIQFNGLSIGASFAGSDSTLELVLSTESHLVRIDSILSRAWACPPRHFDTAAVTGLAHVFLANLWFTGSALQRLPASLWEGFRSEQAQVLRDRVTLADTISQHLRRSCERVGSFCTSPLGGGSTLSKRAPQRASSLSRAPQHAPFAARSLTAATSRSRSQ
jgi:hypothetical protein